MFTEGKEVEGLGYSNIDNYSSIYTNTLSTPSTNVMWDGAINQFMSYSGPGGVLPTIPTRSGFVSVWGQEYMAPSLASGQLRSHISWLNSAWVDDVNNPAWWIAFVDGAPQPVGSGHPTPMRKDNLNLYGYCNNLRA